MTIRSDCGRRFPCSEKQRRHVVDITEFCWKQLNVRDLAQRVRNSLFKGEPSIRVLRFTQQLMFLQRFGSTLSAKSCRKKFARRLSRLSAAACCLRRCAQKIKVRSSLIHSSLSSVFRKRKRVVIARARQRCHLLRSVARQANRSSVCRIRNS